MNPMPAASRVVALIALLAGCATPPAPSAAAPTPAPASKGDPCRGMALDADHPDPTCLVAYRKPENVAADALQIRLAQSPATLRSGAKADFVVVMQNVSKQPLPVDLQGGCGSFEASAFSPTATTFETECGGLCALGPDTRQLHLTLEPGGTVQTTVTLSATMTRVVSKGNECIEQARGALPPGKYTLTVDLPWSDPDPETPGSTRTRRFHAPLVVTP